MTTQIGAFQTSVNQSWNGSPYPVTWAPHLLDADSGNYLSLLTPNYYTNTVLNQLQELQAAGAKAVTVQISFPILYDPFYTYTNNPTGFSQFAAFYKQLASDVHARGMKLVVETIAIEALDGTDGALFAPYYQSLDWNDYMTGRAQNAVNVAQLTNPDYLSLICEPDTESFNASQPTENTPAGALQLLQTNLTAFQNAGITNIPLGAGAGTWIPSFTTYIQDFAATSVNYIDLHVYPVNDSYLMNLLTGMSLAQQSGKSIGVSEAWAEKIADSELGNLDISTVDSRYAFSFWSPIDTAFLQAMVNALQYGKAAFFSPSFVGYFAAYLDYNIVGSETPAQILPAAFTASAAANLAGTFNATGTAFSTMIAGVDTTPPATPAIPTALFSSTAATVSWTRVTDNVGVAGYFIYRDGAQVAQQASTPFYDTGLTPGATYTYNVSAFDAQMNISAESPTLSVTTINTTIPTVPTNLLISGLTPNSVTVSWSPSTVTGGVSGYRVFRGNSPSPMTILAGVTTTSWVDPYALPSSTYYYAVEAYNASGVDSPVSAIVSATTPPIPAPSNLSVLAVAQNAVSLSWSPSLIGGVTGYRVLRGAVASAMTVIAGVTTTSYVDPYAMPSTTYYYALEASNVNGTASVPCAPVSATTLAIPAPANLTVSSVTQNTVSLDWSPTPIGGVTGYRVLKGTSPSAMTVIAGVTNTSYVDTNAAPATTLYYSVEAYNVMGTNSAPSATASALTFALLPPTNLLATSIAKNSVTLSWTASGGADRPVGYTILKGLTPTSLGIIVLSNPGTTFTDTNIGAGTTYYYEVEMKDSVGYASLPGNLLAVTSTQ